MTKKTDSMLFKLTILFLIFAVCISVLTGVLTYQRQATEYERQSQEQVQSVSRYLTSRLRANGEEFAIFVDKIKEYKDEIDLPVDVVWDYREAKRDFERLLAAKYPNAEDIPYEDLDHETMLAFLKYRYIYWTSVFRSVADSFDIEYNYLVTPTGEGTDMYYIIDALEEGMEDDPDRLWVLLTSEEPYDAHEKMWSAWNTGEEPDGFDTYDNEYGKTYAYYTPVVIDGKTIGVVGSEIEIAKVNEGIIRNAVVLAAEIAVALLVGMFILLLIIHRLYIVRLQRFQRGIAEYGQTRNVRIAETIHRDVKGKDEIASVANQFAATITELDEYMKTLTRTEKKLDEANEKAADLGRQAERDALTGIRNRNAYDKEMQKTKWDLETGDCKSFGIAMIDLNFLKKINDTYGHEKGNVAIRRLCALVCEVFEHSPVFRIGGDEFVVILKGRDLDNRDELLEAFRKHLKDFAEDEKLEPWEKISAAIGIAVYDPEKDASVENVFKRADREMYACKKQMKAVRME